MMKDRNDKLAILGERSVQRILYRTHYELDLRLQRCKHYEVYSTHGDDQTQLSEVDLIEKWTSADGVEHTKAHEVKCEEISITGRGSGAVKKTLEEKIGWVFHREKLDDNGVQTEKGFRIKGTGNVFIETEQDVPEGTEATEENKGWAIVLKETEAAASKKYTDGRDVWFVQYTPRDVPNYAFTDLETGEEYQGEYAGLEPYNYFTALQMPDTYITAEIIFGLFPDNYLRETKKRKWNKAKRVEETVISRGYTIPITELYNMDLLEDGVFGKKDDRTGVTFHRDRDVWTCEKDINETWTNDDFKISPLKNDRY